MKWNPLRNKKLPPEVTEKIENVRQSPIPWLVLDKLGLTDIPETVYTLTNLAIIDLRNNNLRLIPDELRHLPNLKQVVLIGNPLESLPDFGRVANSRNSESNYWAKLLNLRHSWV